MSADRIAHDSQLTVTALSTFPEPRPLEKRVGDLSPIENGDLEHDA